MSEETKNDGSSIKYEIIRKSNKLSRGIMVSKSVWDGRIINLLLTKIHAYDEDFFPYEIPITDVLGRSYGGSQLKELVASVRGLMSRPITIQENKDRTANYSIFSKCVIDTQKGVLELCFHPDLKPHLLELKEFYTKFYYEEFRSLNSIYSQNIYELLKSWQSANEVVIKLSDLHEKLTTPVSFRKNFKDFRRRVLEPARREILGNPNSSIWFDWEEIKRGRGGKVESIRFVFSRELAAKFEKNRDPIDIHHEMQKQTNACFTRHRERGVKCVPKMNTAKCKFCCERGMMFAESLKTSNHYQEIIPDTKLF